MLTIVPRPRSGIFGESTNDEAYKVLPGEDRLVKDVMTPDVATVDAALSIQEAMNTIRNVDVPFLVVFHEGEPVLALTQYDLAFYEQAGLDTLRAIVKKRVEIRCREDAILADAIRGMVDHHARQVPVIGVRGGLVGALSLVDALGAITPEAAAAWLPKVRPVSVKPPDYKDVKVFSQSED